MSGRAAGERGRLALARFFSLHFPRACGASSAAARRVNGSPSAICAARPSARRITDCRCPDDTRASARRAWPASRTPIGRRPLRRAASTRGRMPPRLRPRLRPRRPPVARRLPDARPRAPSSAVERRRARRPSMRRRHRARAAERRAAACGPRKARGPAKEKGRARAALRLRCARQNFSISLRIAAKRLPYGGAIIARVFRRGCVSTGFIFENVTKPS